MADEAISEERLAEIRRTNDDRSYGHSWCESAIDDLLAEVDQLRKQLSATPQPTTEYGQKYRGGGYLTRVDSDWMRERWPIEQWIRDNTQGGAVVGKRTIIVIEDWQDIRAEDLPEEVPHT